MEKVLLNLSIGVDVMHDRSTHALYQFFYDIDYFEALGNIDTNKKHKFVIDGVEYPAYARGPQMWSIYESSKPENDFYISNTGTRFGPEYTNRILLVMGKGNQPFPIGSTVQFIEFDDSPTPPTPSEDGIATAIIRFDSEMTVKVFYNKETEEISYEIVTEV